MFLFIFLIIVILIQQHLNIHAALVACTVDLDVVSNEPTPRSNELVPLHTVEEDEDQGLQIGQLVDVGEVDIVEGGIVGLSGVFAWCQRRELVVNVVVADDAEVVGVVLGHTGTLHNRPVCPRNRVWQPTVDFCHLQHEANLRDEKQRHL